MFPCVIPAHPNATPGPGPPSPEAAPAPPSRHARNTTTTVETRLRISAYCRVSIRLRRRRREESLRAPDRAQDAEAVPVDDDQRAPAWAAEDQMPVAVGTKPVVEDVIRRSLPRQVDAHRRHVTRVERVNERPRLRGAVQRVRPAARRRACD